MPSWSTYAVFVPAALALLLVPGPAVFYIVTRSVDQGRAAGMASLCGVHVGSVIHVLAAALGVSVVLARSAEAFTVVKFAGAAYLIFIGCRRLLGGAGGVDADGRAANDRTLRRTFAQGVFVNVLNPKTALFFLAFLPQFVDARRGSTVLQTVVLGACFIVLGVLSDGTYALLASSIGPRLRERATGRQYLERGSGIVYIGLGLYAALAHRPVAADRTA
ncbi:MAG: LysE family translocator [Acidimicrobiia bacterium]